MDALRKPISDDDRLRIEVLMKEYDTLRAELLGRMDSRFALIGTSVAGAAIIACSGGTGLSIAVVGAVVALLLLFWLRSGVLMMRCSEGIAAIEERINDLAGYRLLEWESNTRNRWWWRALACWSALARQRRR